MKRALLLNLGFVLYEQLFWGKHSLMTSRGGSYFVNMKVKEKQAFKCVIERGVKFM